MLDNLLEKILDFFLDSDIIHSLSNQPAFKDIIKKIEDKKFMIHILKYLIFGVLTTIISIGSFWLLIKFTTIEENVCNILSIAIGILAAYVLNREYVFESKEKNIFKEFTKFVMSRILSSLFDIIMFFIFATCLTLNEMVVKIVISICVVIINYVLSKLLVFKQKIN